MRVILYERPGCHLCADALAILRGLGRLEISRVDIRSDPELERRYLVRIPVLAAGDRELEVAGLDRRAIARWLAADGK